MNIPVNRYSLDALLERYKQLKPIADDLLAAEQLLIDCILERKALLVAGNGGSCADAEHIVGELMKTFIERPAIDESVVLSLQTVDARIGRHLSECLETAIPAICLSSQTALTTAFCNDVDPDDIYAQQVYGYRAISGLFWGLSTSGNARNVLHAAVTAKALGLKVLGMTGMDGGELKSYCDVIIRVPEQETFKIQELHLPVYHWLCARIEEYLFEPSNEKQ